MTIMFSIQKSEEFVGATVLIDGTPYPVAKDHPNYDEIESLLLADDEPDEEYLLGLVQPIKGIENALRRYSDRVLVQGTDVLFDGKVIDNSLTQHIIKVLNSDNADERENGYQSLIRFFENLQDNPSEVSKNHLFDFAAHHGLTITDEGYLLFYKGTRANGDSSHAGYGIVTDDEGNTTIYENDYLPNGLNYVVEIPRHLVDEDRHSACSTGLHVGAFSYVSQYFAERIWNVIVHPRDVVAVPHDASSTKVRVNRYQIVGENVGKVQHVGHSINLKTDLLPGAPEEAVVEFEEAINAELNEDNAAAAEVAGAIADLPPVDKNIEKVSEFKKLITGSLLPGGVTKLSTYKNKRITSAQRANFQRAMDELGLK
jgi:hypothetical protein